MLTADDLHAVRRIVEDLMARREAELRALVLGLPERLRPVVRDEVRQAARDPGLVPEPGESQ